MAILGSGQRLPRGPLGFLAGLFDPEHGGPAPPDDRLPGWNYLPPGIVPSPSGPSDADLEYEGRLSGRPSLGRPGTARYAAYPRGGVGRLARTLNGNRPVAAARGAVPTPVGYLREGSGAPLASGSARSTAPGRSAVDRYAQHLLRGGMPPELVQQLREQYEA